jgi:hypothetical protein
MNVYCWAVYWRNQGETYSHSWMTYPKLAERTFTKEDALNILKDVSSRSETIEATFKTIIDW